MNAAPTESASATSTTADNCNGTSYVQQALVIYHSASEPPQAALWTPTLFGQHEEMLDATDHELVWPPELFAAEARRPLSPPRLGRPALDLLLREDATAS
jgi:hypothetical protein